MKCARCGRIIKSGIYTKIGNYSYGSTCARKMGLNKSKVKFTKIETSTENEYQLNLFEKDNNNEND